MTAHPSTEESNPPATQRQRARPVVEFDHHDARMVRQGHAILNDLQSRCPVAWTGSHGGYWVVTGSREVSEVARDDRRFSSQNDHVKRHGVAIPGLPNWAGMIEMDPPDFTPVRKAFVPWFTPKAAETRRTLAETVTDYCIDQIIDQGRGDLTEDVAVPIPALLTMQFLGFPFADAAPMADLFHRHSWVAPGTPERDRLNAEIGELQEMIQVRAAAARQKPGPDFLSFLATVRINGELLTLPQISGHAFLILIGGIDTTAGLLSNSLLHLQEHPEARAALIADPVLIGPAFDEYVRYFSPVPGLARTVTESCVVGGQHMEPGERLWISWAGANLSPESFENPLEVRLDRYPNRHVAFGIGVHRCIGANVAKVIWTTAVRRILDRLPDFQIDVQHSVPFPDVGPAIGWISTPATFTPGAKVGATLSDQAGDKINVITSGYVAEGQHDTGD
jgi:cytochrome P450